MLVSIDTRNSDHNANLVRCIDIDHIQDVALITTVEAISDASPTSLSTVCSTFPSATVCSDWRTDTKVDAIAFGHSTKSGPIALVHVFGTLIMTGFVGDYDVVFTRVPRFYPHADWRSRIKVGMRLRMAAKNGALVFTRLYKNGTRTPRVLIHSRTGTPLMMKRVGVVDNDGTVTPLLSRCIDDLEMSNSPVGSPNIVNNQFYTIDTPPMIDTTPVHNRYEWPNIGGMRLKIVPGTWLLATFGDQAIGWYHSPLGLISAPVVFGPYGLVVDGYNVQQYCALSSIDLGTRSIL